MGLYEIITNNRIIVLRTREIDLIEIANEMCALTGTIAVYTKDYNEDTESFIEIDDWSKTHMYAEWLIDNADNLDIECPF